MKISMSRIGVAIALGIAAFCPPIAAQTTITGSLSRVAAACNASFMNRTVLTGKVIPNFEVNIFNDFNVTGLALAASVPMNDAPIRPPQKEKRYELRGVVKSVDRPNRRATVKHEKVGDYMDAMTMPFLIKDEKALNTMRPGDQIKATLVVTGDGGLWLENVVIMSKGSSSLEEKNAQTEVALANH